MLELEETEDDEPVVRVAFGAVVEAVDDCIDEPGTVPVVTPLFGAGVDTCFPQEINRRLKPKTRRERLSTSKF